ncbi:MAG: hypothetical protein K0S32_4125, partial [Bacteroidetes bacterium]|nr:hypothetical protein [Bacteroidota bacterium]
MLTSLQIKAITYDVNHSGITSSELRDDLFDHICCLVEKELETQPDFKKAYLSVRKQFGSLRAIQIKTDLEIENSKRFNAFIKVCNYVFVSFYM